MSIKQQFFIIKRQKTFWSTMLLCALTLLITFTGTLDKLNALIYLEFSQNLNRQNTQVVVIESNNLLAEQTALISKLREQQAKAIVIFSHVGGNQQLSFDNVYFPYADPRYCLPTLESWLGYEIIIQQAPSHCKSVWQAILGEQYRARGQLLDFSLAPQALTKFSSDRLLSDDVFLTQLQDKVVLVSQYQLNFALPVRAPKIDTFRDPVYLHAYIADNFLEQTLVTLTPTTYAAVMQLLILAILLITYQRCSFSTGLMIACVVIVCCILSAYVCVRFFNYFLPSGQIIFTNLVTLLWVFFSRKWAEEIELNDIIGNVQQRMMGRYLPQAFSAQSSPWDAIITLVNQQLALKRSIFLARTEGDHRLHEIRAINCSLSDIHEMRRDYERPPYSDAIKAFGALHITRPFFNELTESEAQYVVPLMYAGDIRGFWAMTVEPNEYFDEERFIQNVNRFANQIGELLFHFRIFENQQKANTSALTKALTLALQKPLSQQVKSSIGDMEQKLSTLEHVFNQIHTAAIMFNLFGQVVQTNQRIEEIAKHNEMSLFEMTALDLLERVTHLDSEKAKGKLRYITLQQGELYMPAQLGQATFILSIRSLRAARTTSSIGEPFEVGGILFEFIDISFLIKQLEDPAQLIKQLEMIQPISELESHDIKAQP
ncbi:hypothetical protein [Pseudoalteromonas luteoviolacea]|uniref:CHASE2 domain-containing protein n=1 Tax=Pseudoalteromonas luteoviolacea (strain 2ta16) TaxID=1353533 RepID=V4JJ73_PSEL2|nr:hypothetical protein [Pseudoalteromonas luteoviolacea]ESP94922.1 hypothetical protein PL2TA16_04708 [Pseudoalteromonas luteoviolacea 2ta16]KZN33405.1 hypothetical protein N483_02005 [Pseudoalteromonas luteoviolacea NCIMB 1944]